MPAHRCSICALNFPTSVENCHVCGSSLDFFQNAVPAAEWEREVQLRTLDETRSEEVRVVRWRRLELVRAGFELKDAEILAERLDVDLHRARGLLANGCPEPLAVEILL